MLKSLATPISALAIAVLMAPTAQGGASTSAPTKYAQRSQQVTRVHMVRQTKRIEPPITDFSAQAKTAPFDR
ncbi:hypothetical protein [Bradyrhizobium erythrophlei]|uniref:Uncharacterized protein n=1 Tax=Bradyrhizobium erythrophlei TaxID=1437360 RepID=A0A1H4WHH1_9BRAD|nr:hypothetical protein [Bradyrhizobium erythrophlei]SEC92540.1 hypothetical protein SAMN05444164_3118 [Bradyrhizobium erythrophlei]